MIIVTYVYLWAELWQLVEHEIIIIQDEQMKDIKKENGAPFTDCISKINNTQTDNAQYKEVVIAMYNLIEHSVNYAETKVSL